MRASLIGGAVLIFTLLPALRAQETRPAERNAVEAKAAAAFDDQKWDEASAGYREVVKLDDKNAEGWHRLGYSLHMLHKLDEALEAHLKSATFPRTRALGYYNAACAYALKKDKDKAFECLTKAAEAGFNQVETITEDDDLASLHDDPRWEQAVTAVKNASSRPKFQPIAQPGDRKASRVVWFGARGAPAAAVSWGAVGWRDSYSEQIKSPKLENHRWRLGKDFWTTLDTSIGLSFGATTVPPGYYYLTLEKKSSGDYVLQFNDAAEVRKLKLDAFQADKTKGGVEVPLAHEDTKDSASKLDIKLSIDADDPMKGAITILFGPHKLSAPIAYQVVEK